jgi:hypothetical protein
VPQKAAAGANIGELLLREGLITNAQLDEAVARQRETEMPLVRILVESGNLDETKRINFFKRQFGVPMVTLEGTTVDPLLFTYIPSQMARRNHLVPVKLDRDGLVVAMEDPSDVVLLDDLKGIVGLRIKPVLAPSDQIVQALKAYPEAKEEEAPVVLATEFDPATRLLSFLFLPVMSLAALGGIFLLVMYNPDFQSWLREHLSNSPSVTNQYFTLFLYFFLSWGVWTIIMWEIRGLVFDDLEWRPADELGEEKLRSKALTRSLFLGFLGVDRFYLGYRRMGVLKVITLGLLGVWWAFDFFLILTNKVPDAAGRKLG